MKKEGKEGREEGRMEGRKEGKSASEREKIISSA
jgi:hypothetical protein